MSGSPQPSRLTTDAPEAWGLEALRRSRATRRGLQESIAEIRDQWICSNPYLYDSLKKALRFVVEPDRRVLEIRCLTGHLLASVNPSEGVGVEIGEKMVNIAQANYPHLRFAAAAPEELALNEKFDYVIFNHVSDTVDILTALERAHDHCTARARLIVINYNQLWQPLLAWLSKLGLRAPFVEPNWVNEQDLRGFLGLAAFRVVRTYRFLMVPKRVPLLSWFLNDMLARLPGLRRLCLMELIVARPVPKALAEHDVSVSVIVPCRNERGNIQPAVERIPEMGKYTEIIFGDDKSTDGTADEVRRMQALYPKKNIQLVDSPGICKAENVWTCFNAASGDVLMILDADLTVMPEELPYFFRALVRGHGEFINGSRLVYPVPKLAMKFTNRIGNKVFGLVFSFLLDQRIKDTLCGTKVLWRADWYGIVPLLGSWGLKDLWGDYELLFGAAKLNLEIVEVPVHYQERIYGVTKMTRVLKNGLRMLGICWNAWRRLA
jgi:hypothetical protein